MVAAKAGAAGLIIINNSSQCLYPELDDDSTDVLSHIFIASTPLDDAAQHIISAALESLDSGLPVYALYSSIRTYILDPAALVLLCLAVATLLIAAAWTGSEYKRALATQEPSDSLGASSESQPASATGEAGMHRLICMLL